MSTQLFHFTLDPVQSFVAQARRTRDLWAGSFLLSWLAGQAMVKVRRQGGRIVFPSVGDKDKATDPLIAAIEGQRDSQPRIGSLPNRFKAEVPDNFDAKAVGKALVEAWQKLAVAVWSQFVEPAASHGNGTRVIWDRQVNNFWEISWVQGDARGDRGDDRWLDARKNWRNRWPEPEAGCHCALMGDMQELSGYVGTRERGKQKDFWQALASHTGALEFREHEYLCAIALIKRLFPRLETDRLQQAIGWVPGGKPEAIGNWPSTAYMAIIPWLRGFINGEERREALRRYEDEVIAIAGNTIRGERSTYIASLKPLRELAWMDGNFFLPNALQNGKDTPLQKAADLISNNDPDRVALSQKLRKLQCEHPPQPYYALLLLDGDHLGRHLSGGDPGAISRQLATFSQGVSTVVGNHDGVTLYAGGDDVLALLPMDCALDCAVKLRADYGSAFSDDPAFTASVAIVFAHYHLPLRDVLAEAHRQLDEVAKEGNGRDSLALGWFKASGKAAKWVATWHDGKDGEPARDLQALAKHVQDDGFGSGFFYKLSTRYPMLNRNQNAAPVFPGIERMLQAEYVKTRERKTSPEQAEQAIGNLVQACRLSRRDEHGNVVADESGQLQLDGLRLARLLAGKEARE